MAENVCNTAAVSDMSDEEILIKYCLDNKINKTALDELLKRGFDSLDALKLVYMEDLSSQNIPMGQRRLIFHIAQALNTNEPASTQELLLLYLLGTPGFPLQQDLPWSNLMTFMAVRY